ncbi:MAG: hypothetical protein JST00_23305 [Deltaproteobacteria bacterium]|nr:hypothetical protein [Deltaproteobacteria bacterium]
MGACLALATACVHDGVLPDQEIAAVCGNGLVEPGEACDVASPGCVACNVVPTYTCTPRGCTTTCGDGVVGENGGCTSPRREASCDMTGYWAARESTYLRETILGGLQISSNWFFLRFQQDGEGFRVVEGLDCGILVTGSATVRYSPESLRAILHANRQEGSGSRPARRGVARAVPSGCEVSLERWYNVRGLSEDFLPPDFTTKPPLDSLRPMPTVRDPAGSERPEGAIDPDADGYPGLAFQISGIAGGVRNALQRDYKEFATPAGASVPANAMTLVIPGAFDLQENVMRVTECGGSCSLIATLARVAKDIPAKIALSWVGRTIDGPRTRLVAPRPPGESLDADLAICANVRLLLPHDGRNPLDGP